MTRWFRTFLVFLLCVSSASADPEVAPQAAANARAIAYQAKAAYDAGDYAVAQQRAAAAYALVPAPTLALLEARSLRQLKRWVSARERYRVAAQPLPPAAPAAFARARRDALQELEVLEAQLPRVLVVLSPSKAKLSELDAKLNGAPLKESLVGVATPLDPGAHELSYRVKARSVKRPFQLDPGEIERLVIDAVPSAPAAAHAAERDSREDSLPGQAAAWQRYAIWGALSVGAAGIGIGVWQGLDAVATKSRLERACPDLQCPPQHREDIRDYRHARDLSTAGYVVGAASLAAGGILLWQADSRTTTLSAHAGYGRAWVRGRF